MSRERGRSIFIEDRIEILGRKFSKNELEKSAGAANNAAMNSSSFLMLLIFVAIGYVAHPILLPLVEDKLPKPEVEAGDDAVEAGPEVTTPPAVVESVPAPQVEPTTPVVVEVPVVTPPIIDVAAEPLPVVKDDSEDAVVETAAPAMSESQVISILRKSINAGELTGFEADDVKALALAGEEEFDGVNYQIGLGTVNMTTIFGLTEQKVKALCINGKVVKWLWAASSVEIQ
jgi:hypothetical protein